jgi:hypothetical protein
MPANSTLLEPKMAVRPGRKDDPLEVSVHTLPKPLVREFRHVFAENYLAAADQMEEDSTLEILAIPTNQQARKDLVAIGDGIEQEKDRLLNVVRVNSTEKALGIYSFYVYFFADPHGFDLI